MSAINFVVRDVAGNISRGSVAGEGVPSSLIVGAGADVSLNLTQGQIVSYTRQGQALEITLIDGRVIVIEGYFTTEGVSENELFLSADGYLTEVDLTQGAGADYFANYSVPDTAGKFAANEDLFHMRGADVMLADSYVPEDDEVGMLALGGLAPLFGWGGAAVAAGAAALVGGGGSGGPDAPAVEVTVGADSTDHVVNEADHADGVDVGGTGTPGGEVAVTVQGTTETTTVDIAGNWVVTFDPADIETGEYETPIDVSITNSGGTTTITDTLVVDTIIGVDANASGGTDGVINGVEHAAGVTLTGTVTGGDTVVVTIDGTDFDATVTGTTWTLDVPASVLGEGEYTQTVTITATDPAGNASSTTSTVVVDTVTSVTLDTSSVGGADNVVNGTEHAGGVTLNGTAQAGSSVVVTMGTVSQTVIATSAGTWTATYTSAQVPTGEETLNVTAVATDAAGNTASASGTVTVDTFVNELDLTSNSAGGADGVVNFDESGQAITMTGTVEAGSTVSVSLHGVVMGATVDANGGWSVTYPGGTLPGGEYDTTVTVTATDAAGNTSSLSDSVTVDTVAGDLALSTQPIEIDDVVNMVEAQDGVIINGTATPGLIVTVGFGSSSMNVLAQPNGTWSANFPASMVPADTASAQITASITDAAGNYKEVSDTVAVDTVVQPHEWSANAIEGDNVINANEAANGVVLSGTTEPNSTIMVEFGGEVVNVVSGASGAWSANFSSGSVNANDEYMASMKATATDPAGNVSVITSSVEVDTWVNNLTTADPVEGDNVVNAAEAADGVTLNGTVEAGSTVMVSFAHPNGTITQEAIVLANGNWSVTYAGADVPLGEYDANITIAATDANGNTDSITDTFKVDTSAPVAPGIENVVLDDDGVEAIKITATDNDVAVTEITSSGSTAQLADQDDGDLNNAGTKIEFEFDAPLPDGSHLVVNETDSAGNDNATYLVLEETGTNTVDMSGLDGFDIGAIDLSFAKDAELTLDLATIEGLSDTDNNLVIHGGVGDNDQVTIVGASDSGTSTTINGESYDIYTMGDDAQIFIEDGITVNTTI
ncbi:Ig-like domain-containing protein [Octadecabacter sp. G9-8]|uniref:Ig-like domain-containing protein n=1 Tax=Octadecabacter dasysiphoniae TaxID=2909341 RepID=A0ABS9CVR1_9RHOB|nr:Ig-like domain-containing protein [Octadecabacter dasysiphoniae]MCF2870271.1 Ig-like domain-containing protein [Octadecabacter dasysiphoniae]